MNFEGLLVLAIIVVIAIPIVVIGLWIAFSNQNKKLQKLTKDFYALRSQVQDMRHPVTAPLESDTGKPAKTVEKPEESKPEIAASANTAPDAKAATPPAIPPAPPTPPVPPATTLPQPSPVADALAKLGSWLQENWFYAVSALSLALAGIFLVQYGMENGYLPPRARVAAALAFGAALIGAGEYIRRRFGDSEAATTAYLPSVFSGAGIVTLFGAILSARMMYDLIGGGAAMSGMVIVALVALVLGWLHGPLLAAIGIIGAYGAPVVLGSSNTDASPLFAYFGIIAVLGLGVDTMRRWGWISVLTLVLAFLSGWGLLGARGQSVDWAAILYFAALPVLAILIPARGFMPDHGGPTLVEAVFGQRKTGQARVRPIFPVFIAVATVAAGTLSLIPFFQSGEIEVWLACFVLTALTGLLIFWSARAPALQDIAVIPAVGLLIFVWFMGVTWSAPYRVFNETYATTPEAGFPWAVTLLVLIGALISVLAAARSLRGGDFRLIWAGAAALFAPAMAILLEVSWRPAEVIGIYPWALHAAALAALMVALAERFARADGSEDRLRTSFAVIAALSSMAFAFVIVLSSAALTIAFAVTVLAAAALDRQWKLPPLSLFILAGVVTLGYRLVVDPGLDWGRLAPLPEMLLAYGGTLAALVASLWLLRPLTRPLSQITLDSAAWSVGATLVSLLLFRWIDQYAPPRADQSHWAMGLMATIWLGMALAQLQRTELGGMLRYARWGLAGIFAFIGGGALFLVLIGANPLGNGAPYNAVLGPPLLNTLITAYLLPALILLGGAIRLKTLDRRVRIALTVIAGGISALWAMLVIRHFWQGPEMMTLYHGFAQGELYTYTIALLLLGGGLFYQSLARRSAMMRKAGLVVIGLAVAKVFLADISGLDGLTRVFSLLVLGLSLAGLAWLNRWAQDRYGRDDDVSPPDVPQASTDGGPAHLTPGDI